MSDFEGGDRSRWEGFPGGVGPADEYPTGPVPAYDPGGEPTPEAPQFPLQQPVDETAPMPVVPAAAAGAASAASAADPSGSGLGPRRSRSHAAPRPDTSKYIAVACAAAVVLVGSGFAFVSCNNDDVATSGINNPVVPLTSPSVTPSTIAALPSSSAIPTTSTTPTRSTTPSASSTASASATGGAEPSPSATPSATAAGKKQPVTVLNSTAITGLAKRVAADIVAGGWTVTKTTNWTGSQPSRTTIYYLPGAKNKASAQLFARKFDVAQDIRPALPGMTSNLTLVLTRDAS